MNVLITSSLIFHLNNKIWDIIRVTVKIKSFLEKLKNWIKTYVYSKNLGFLSPAGSNVSVVWRKFAHLPDIVIPGV